MKPRDSVTHAATRRDGVVRNGPSMRNTKMRKSYDFTKSTRNPYARRMKKQITIRIDEEAISYFKTMAEERGIPYQTLMNLYLLDCATSQRKLQLKRE